MVKSIRIKPSDFRAQLKNDNNKFLKKRNAKNKIKQKPHKTKTGNFYLTIFLNQAI